MEIINKIGSYRSGGWYSRSAEQIKKITVHHSAMKQDGRQTHESVLKSIQRVHEGHGWPGLSYHFVVMPDGAIYQTNGFLDVTWHDTKNWDSIGVLVHGYFHPPVNEAPTENQLNSLRWLLDDLCNNHPEFPADQGDVVGHRERSATACPGDHLFPYVTEYREKLGDVSWGENKDMSRIDELQEALISMRSSRDKWKRRHEEAQKTHAKEINERDAHITSLQKSQSEMNLQLTNITKQFESLQKENTQIRSQALVTQDELRAKLVAGDERIAELEKGNERLLKKIEKLERQVNKKMQLREDQKLWYTSKTLWVNILALLAVVLQGVFGYEIDAELQPAILGIINIVLRAVTQKEIVWELPMISRKDK